MSIWCDSICLLNPLSFFLLSIRGRKLQRKRRFVFLLIESFPLLFYSRAIKWKECFCIVFFYSLFLPYVAWYRWFLWNSFFFFQQTIGREFFFPSLYTFVVYFFPQVRWKKKPRAARELRYNDVIKWILCLNLLSSLAPRYKPYLQ